jgi:hypothetical protein
MINKCFCSLFIVFLLFNQSFARSGERINGPANIRDTINGRVLFTLEDNIPVECTEGKNNWHIVALNVRISPEELKNFKIAKGKTLVGINGEKVGITISETPLWRADENNGIKTGFIRGYTFKENIKPESVIENVLKKIIEEKSPVIVENDLKGIIDSFKLKKCSQSRQPDEKGEWYCYGDNLIEDISPRDRITLIIENERLIGVVHSHQLNLKNMKTYELIRGHKFTPVANLTQEKIDMIVKERIKWYKSID